MSIVKGFVLPGLPQPLLTPDANPGYRKLRSAFEKVRAEIEASDVDLILVYSTMWPSILGHQIQARPKPKWVHVDEQFHDLGSIPYEFEIDTEFAKSCCRISQARGLHARTIDYDGFPIDTGSVVALKLINPDNRVPACIVSSNIYSDRVETVVLGKAARQAAEELGRKVAVVVVSTLSNRLLSEWIDPKDDHITSAKDEEWNQKMLEFFSDGRLEDLSQLSRQIQREARVKKVVNFKSFWWMSAVMGQHNRYKGEVFEYQPVFGTGSAVIGLTPADEAARDLEFDEDDPEKYVGDRNVLAPSAEAMADFSSQQGFTDESSQERIDEH